MVKLYKHVLGARGEIVPQRPAVYITHKRTHAIHLKITGSVPDLYINNLRRTHAFSNHEAGPFTFNSFTKTEDCFCEDVHAPKIAVL